MKILFIASDNNATSGAFLSMVALNQILHNNLSVDTFVVLPREGTGQALLDEVGIPWTTVKSYDWVVPMEQSSGLKYSLKKSVKQMLNIRAVSQLRKVVKNYKPDIVHINTTYAYVGAIAALRENSPFVWHLREFVEEDQGRTLWDRSKGDELIAQANKVIAISTSVYKKYENIIPKEKLCVILNGIDTNRFYRPEKKIYQNEKFILVYGGGYARRKGIYEFASALKLLVDMGITDFEVQFIGEPNEKYKQHLTKIGLDPYIKYLGYQKNVTQWYEKADMAFSCSKAEAFGRKTVEAMLAGTLMIAANTAGTLDIIFDKKTGLLYQQGDPIDLAFKILYAMKNKEECQAIAKNGREFAYNNLSALKNAEEIKKVYDEILTLRK